jgi:hypothetical protein
MGFAEVFPYGRMRYELFDVNNYSISTIRQHTQDAD